MASRALINYYSRLIKKGVYKLENIPDDVRDDVKKVLEDMTDDKSNLITQTYEEK